MPALEKAKLQRVKADENETRIGDPVDVQFNPTTLSLKLRNQVEGGRSNARQRRQQTGASSNVLTMDLIFDTADEGTAEAPVSVRTKTAIVEQFVVPEENNPDPPPRLQFQWDALVLTGIVEEVNVEFDLFASNGVPLRAKVGLSIKEQKPSYQFLRGGAGARNSNNSTAPGGGNAASQPGSGTNGPAGASDGGAGDRVAPALDGETPAEFAGRMGLDPAAWRGLSADLSLGLGFAAGVEVGFSASLSAGVGIGVSAGIQAGIGVSLEASLGLAAGTGGAGTGGGDAAGRAMAEAGGITASIDAVAISRADTAASATTAAFDQPGAASSAGTAAPASGTRSGLRGAAAPGSGVPAVRIERTPLVQTGTRTHTEQAMAPAWTPPPAPDPRSVSFGYGVPLQPLRATIRTLRAESLCVRGRGDGSVLPPVRTDVSVAPWIALPAIDDTRTRVDALEREKTANPCALLAAPCCRATR